MKRYLLLVASFLWSWQAIAWDISLNSQSILLKNTQAISQSNVYLAWFDLDANKLLSFSVENGWQDALQPAFETPIDIPIFDSFPAANIPAICPAEHRCFLAFVDVPNNTNVLEMEKWRNGAILPLSAQAAYERLPNQTFFLTKQQNNSTGNSNDGVVYSAAPTTVNTAAPNKATETTTTTEKPDIFQVDGQQVLFANGSANKFQIIDVSNVNNPRLKVETILKGTPKEIYTINGFYGLMQSDNESSRLTVFSMTGINVVEPVHIGNAFAHLPVFHWTLNTVAEQKFDGYFLQSRRRNDVIFSVNQSYNQNGAQLQLNATLIDSLGNVSTIDSNSLQGYDPKIAIFPDHLVIANNDPQNWNNSIITVFDLSKTKPLTPIGQIEVSGKIPSEFHLNVQNAQLRVVYGSSFNSEQGSTLAIYDLSKVDLPLIGKVEKIAPNEALFATRFVGDMAYVVTYQRKDPLWAIDLSNPKEPVIKGELIVPGWSELMFFNQNHLFAIGFDDQLATGENWARRVSASLFDVNNATDLKLVNKITPLFGKTSYTYSQATSDERALLLDWNQQIAAFPLESWEGEANSYLQLLRFKDNKLSDAGLLGLPLTPQRSLLLDQEKLGILSDQVFFTANISNNDPKLLGELELARNLQWLTQNQGKLIAAAQGSKGFYRIYQFSSNNLSQPLQTWSLAHDYNAVQSDGKLAVFFNQNPLTIQIFDIEKQQLFPPQSTDFKSDYWGITNIVDNGYFYIANQQYFDIQPLHGINEEIKPVLQPYIWIVNRWKLDQGKTVEEKAINSAGQPMVISGNLLISQEDSYSNNPRLNLLSFDKERAKLLDSLALDCRINSYLWVENALYVSCQTGDFYYYPTLMNNAQESFAPQTPTFSLLKITVQQNHLRISGRWSLTGSTNVIGVKNQSIVLGNENNYTVRPLIAMDSMYYPYSNAVDCSVYRLEATQLVFLKKLDNCKRADQSVLLENGLFQTADFKDIQYLNW